MNHVAIVEILICIGAASLRWLLVGKLKIQANDGIKTAVRKLPGSLAPVRTATVRPMLKASATVEIVKHGCIKPCPFAFLNNGRSLTVRQDLIEA